jgi:hypothetical protein
MESFGVRIATAPYKACHPLKNSTKIISLVSNTAYLHCGAWLTTLPLI